MAMPGSGRLSPRLGLHGVAAVQPQTTQARVGCPAGGTGRPDQAHMIRTILIASALGGGALVLFTPRGGSPE